MTTDAIKFFYDHAGYSYDPTCETPEQGRVRCAEALALAEQKASAAGVSFYWSHDLDIDSSDFISGESAYPLWECVARRLDGTIIASLGGVDFGENGEPWGEPYRRVVEAELAQDTVSPTRGQ